MAALHRLTEQELRGLQRVARNRAWGLHAVDWRDLLQEAVSRMLDGRRRWRKRVALPVFLAGVVRSIASDHWRRLDDAVLSESEYATDGQAGVDVVGRASDEAGDPARQLSAEQTLERVEAEFADDPEALAVIGGVACGCGPGEIQREVGMDETRYATVRRRIRRRLAKAFPEYGEL